MFYFDFHIKMKSDFSKILVCSDGSKYSKNAIRKACSLAKKYHSELTLIHVVDRTRKSDVFAGNEYTQILRRYAKSTLEKSKKIANEEGFEPKVIIKEGIVANEIIKFSKEAKTDLLVVGSKGLGAVLQFFLGSVSSKIANRALCSVLIVK
jgi:nucleotide-binding universal stress UspA family protein